MDETTKRRFVGTWELVSWESSTPDGQTAHPFGARPVGRITYTEEGYVSAAIMRANRAGMEVDPEALHQSRLGLLWPSHMKAVSRFLKAASDYVSYSGWYRLERDRVLHHVEVSLLPDWVGTVLERSYEFTDEGLLVLCASTEGATHTLTWRRLPSRHV
jgi:hypothetical protein